MATGAASNQLEKSIHNRRRPPSRPAPYITTSPPYPAGHPFLRPPLSPFDSYFEYYVPGALPRPFNYVNKPLPPPPPSGPATERYLSLPDPQLIRKIVTQIDYYFSFSNLIKDIYLRQNMDGYGWVSIRLIANFSKIKQLTDNIELILYAVRTSSSVMEVWEDKVRRRCDWKRWILPPNMFPADRFCNKSNDSI